MERAQALATSVVVAVLLAAAPSPAGAVSTLTAATDSADPLAPLVAAIALVAWSLAGWLLLVALAVSLSLAPGAAGRMAAVLTRRLAPAAVRRLVEVSLGVTVAVGVVGSGPASASAVLPPAPPGAAVALDWPTAPAPAAAPTLDTSPAAPERQALPAVQPVVVRPGDTLWAVAADHLPHGASDAQIAQAWPQWWAANRAAVGPDPGLIHPGLQLVPPAHP